MAATSWKRTPGMSLGDTVRRTPRIRPSPGRASPSSASTSCPSHRMTSIRTYVRSRQPLAHPRRRTQRRDRVSGVGGVEVVGSGGVQVVASAGTWSPERMSLTSSDARSPEPAGPSAPGNQTYGMPRRSAYLICLPNLSAAGATSHGIPRARSDLATASEAARDVSATTATSTQDGRRPRRGDQPTGEQRGQRTGQPERDPHPGEDPRAVRRPARRSGRPSRPTRSARTRPSASRRRCRCSSRGPGRSADRPPPRPAIRRCRPRPR